MRHCLVALIAFAALFPGTSMLLAHAPEDVLLASLTRAIAAHPADPRPLIERAEIHRRAGRWGLARDDLERARALAPAAPEVDLVEARWALDGGRHDAGLAAIERFLERRRDDVAGLRLKAQILAAAGRMPEAIAAFDRVLTRDERPRPEDFIARARLEAQRGYDAGALAVLDRAARRLGTVVSIEMQAIEIERRLGRYDSALARLERLGRGYGREESILAAKGDLLFAAGRSMEALVAWSDALRAIEVLPPARRLSLAARALEARLEESLAAAQDEPR